MTTGPDVRVHVIGADVYAALVDSESAAAGPTDRSLSKTRSQSAEGSGPGRRGLTHMLTVSR